jgi:EAL domain-containing protein (putative c-di-GMP-specific phosphodiesterase class I)
VATSSDDAAIAKAIIDMGRTLGLTVVAEGVEDFEQIAFLGEHGCPIVQGFLVASPMTAQDATAYLSRASDLTIIRRVRSAAAGEAAA